MFTMSSNRQGSLKIHFRLPSTYRHTVRPISPNLFYPLFTSNSANLSPNFCKDTLLFKP